MGSIPYSLPRQYVDPNLEGLVPFGFHLQLVHTRFQPDFLEIFGQTGEGAVQVDARLLVFRLQLDTASPGGSSVTRKVSGMVEIGIGPGAGQMVERVPAPVIRVGTEMTERRVVAEPAGAVSDSQGETVQVEESGLFDGHFLFSVPGIGLLLGGQGLEEKEGNKE